MSVQLDAAFNYNDLQGLDTLKKGVRHDDPEALKVVAQQFESMFIGLIMKSMRDATDVMASDLENSYQTKFYRDMHDQQLSLSLSQSGGFGLADVLYEQISQAQNPVRPDLYNIDVKPMDESIRPILPAGVTLNQLIEKSALPFSSLSDVDDASSVLEPKTKEGKGAMFSSPEEFIRQLMPAAESAAKTLGLAPEILIAQAALETGWGKFVIQDDSGKSSNNLFGIKADQRWQGESALTTTHEYVEGNRLTVKEPFRAYDSVEDSFNDYVSFVSNSPRYQSAVNSADKGENYLKELQAAGYATDPNYAEKITRIARSEWFEKV